MNPALIFIGQGNPVPQYFQYKYYLPEQAKKELMDEISKLISYRFNSEKELQEFISDPRNVEISTVTVKIYG